MRSPRPAIQFLPGGQRRYLSRLLPGLTRPRQVAISVDRMAAGANRVPRCGGTGRHAGLPRPVPMSAPIATTGLAEKTQISIVQLLTISGAGHPKEASQATAFGRCGIPVDIFLLEALGTSHQPDGLDDGPARYQKATQNCLSTNSPRGLRPLPRTAPVVAC